MPVNPDYKRASVVHCIRWTNEMEVSEFLTILFPKPGPRFRAELERDRLTGKISGFIVSDEFHGRLDLERQTQFWNSLEQKLGERASVVGTVLLFTPEEYEAMTAIDEAG